MTQIDFSWPNFSISPYVWISYSISLTPQLIEHKHYKSRLMKCLLKPAKNKVCLILASTNIKKFKLIYIPFIANHKKSKKKIQWIFYFPKSQNWNPPRSELIVKLAPSLSLINRQSKRSTAKCQSKSARKFRPNDNALHQSGGEQRFM